MLAKELKIKNIKMQREFIKRHLQRRLEHPSKDGDTSYCYMGHILPEVIDYFNREGFKVKLITSDILTAATKGLPIYLFTISDDVVLNAEELKAAEEVEYKSDEDEEMDSLDDLLASLLEGNL